MSRTVHERSAQMMLDQMMADPDGPETLRLAYSGIRDKRWGADYIDALGQNPRGESWPMEQIAVLARLHAMTYSGLIATVTVSTRRGPRPDRDREGNAALLADLPHPFTAYVDMHQNNEDGDGLVEWSEPIRMSVATGLIDRDPDGSTHPLTLSFMMPPGSATLEIGQSLASRTWSHLVMDGGRVARWPYGHPRFWLFINHDWGSWQNKLLGEFLHHREPAA
jgi:hypothetical protein